MRPTKPVIATIGLLISLAAAPSAPAQEPADLRPATRKRIEATIQSEMDRQGIPGLSIAVVVDGEVRWTAGFGLADLENDVPATAETVYRLGSIAKPITAIATMQLAEQGQLDLDAPVQRYVPEFPEKKWPVTCRQLLSHLGGIRHYRGDEINSTRRYRDVIGPLQIFRDDPLLHEPGTKFAYTTYGFNLLGGAVERAAGEPFLAYVTEHVFKPAGTRTLQVDDSDAIIRHRAQGYRRGPDGQLLNSRPADTSNKVPGGGMCGTVDDLARFAIAVLDDRLVRPETRAAMFEPQRTRDGQVLTYGLGWNVVDRGGRREVWHGGGQQRISTMLYMRPDNRVVIALMTNLEGAKLVEFARTLADQAEGRAADPQVMSRKGRYFGYQRPTPARGPR